jgi:DNA-binding transcriptional MocR family regulator
MLSQEAAGLRRSVMRDLLKHAVDPDIISLAGGLPAGEYLPVTDYADCLQTVLNRDGSAALQYSPQYRPLCEWIAEYMRGRGVTCTADQVCITSGNQHGLTMLSRLFLDTSRAAFTEAITFTGVQQVTSGRGAEVLTAPVDLETGVEIDALEEAFALSPALAVIIPDFHNPLGVSLSGEKRQRIAQIAATYNVPVVEDDPYSALRFSGVPLPSIKAYDEAGCVFYLGSFSKMLAPALRLGWLIAPEDMMPRLITLRESIDLESSTLTQRAVYEFLSRGLLEPHLKRLNAAHSERAEAMMAALDELLGDAATWTRPEGGLFTWVVLPEQIDTWALFEKAIEQKVAFIPGGAFAVHGGYGNTMRLNFSKVTPEQIVEGVRRLAAVIRDSL